MQWIQKKFAPAPKKASDRAVKYQDGPDAAPVQDEVFQVAPTGDPKAMQSVLKEKQVLKRPKQPAREVHLTVRTCQASVENPLSTNIPRQTLKFHIGS